MKSLKLLLNELPQKEPLRDVLKTTPSIDPLEDFITIKQLINKYPCFTEGGIRALIFWSDKNGFKKCYRKIGRKILISRSAFFKWIDENEGGK